MNVENILANAVAVIASVGAVIAALFGIARASGGHLKNETQAAATIPAMVDQYLGQLKAMETAIQSAVETLRDIRKALEGTSHRQEAMVREMESMNRSISRIENAQSASAQLMANMRANEEMQVQILAQIREGIKGLDRLKRRPHIVDD